MLRGIRGRLAVAVATAALATGMAATAPVAAITHGSLDGSDHPYVGLMTAHAESGEYLWRCSGTLVNPTLFITAGHCTEPDDSQGFGPPTYAIVFFSDTLITPDPAFTLTTRSCDGIAGYPCGDANETAIRGSIYLHPDFDSSAFFTHDLGIVVLDEPYNPGSFGALPDLDQLDSLHPGRSTTFTSVGFGLQKSFPDAAAWKNVGQRVRMVANPWLYQINGGMVRDYALLLSNNAAAGGTCFGDSGGPNFVGDSNVLAGVTSFGMNSACGGTGGVYRIDREDDLDFIGTFLP